MTAFLGILITGVSMGRDPVFHTRANDNIVPDTLSSSNNDNVYLLKITTNRFLQLPCSSGEQKRDTKAAYRADVSCMAVVSVFLTGLPLSALNVLSLSPPQNQAISRVTYLGTSYHPPL